MKRLFAPLLLVAVVLGLAACNTMAGFGQDVQKVGDKIEGAAKKNK